MRNLILIATILVSATAFAAPKTATANKTTPAGMNMKDEGFKLIHVADLDQWMHMNSQQVFIFDANNDDTRMKDGVIPGAKALATSSSYDVATTLPTNHDAKLVFYCANTECMASHAAASRAVKAGYKNVSVMADGIQGWKKAGKPTEKMNKKTT